MTEAPRVVKDNVTLAGCFSHLQRGDIVCCRLCLKNNEEHLLLDLVERGINLIPSATSQLASRSKVFQTRLLLSFMPPGTVAVYDLHGLLSAVSSFHPNHTKIILKKDRKNGGLGVHLFNQSEDIFTLAANNVLSFPFVLQPFIAGIHDVRVIIIGDYWEAYQRTNPDNFRKNLHCGGQATPWSISEEHLAFCRQAMKRAAFPYCHIDLLVTDIGTAYLSEINLRGGIRGAAISPREYGQKTFALQEELLRKTLNQSH